MVALDVIKKVGIGGNSLTEKHTLKHVRDIWQPKVFDCSIYSTWEVQGKKSAFDKPTEMAGWILANHKRFLWSLVWHRRCVELLRQHNEI
jgi:trimethylamine--corrinoid protein Co-methyltransferase